MEFNHKCWNPLGELSFLLGNDEMLPSRAILKNVNYGFFKNR